MFKVIHIISIFSLMTISSWIEKCSTGKEPYTPCGNITDSFTLNTQEDVNLFRQQLPEGCNCYKGKVQISGNQIQDLSPLNFLKGIGELDVLQLTNLTILKGFQNLDSVYQKLSISSSGMEEIDAFHSLRYTGTYVILSRLTMLKKVSGFSQLEKCENLVISANPLLTEIPPFQKLKIVDQSLNISGNNSLKIIDGFKNVDTVKTSIIIRDHDLLTKISGFNQVSYEGKVVINNNRQLRQISGFSSLINGHTISIYNNPSLQSIDAFYALENIIVFGLLINDNPELNAISGLSKLKKINKRLEVKNNSKLRTCCFLFKSLNDSSGSFTYEITGNAKGCLSKEDILEVGACK